MVPKTVAVLGKDSCTSYSNQIVNNVWFTAVGL